MTNAKGATEMVWMEPSGYLICLEFVFFIIVYAIFRSSKWTGGRALCGLLCLSYFGVVCMEVVNDMVGQIGKSSLQMTLWCSCFGVSSVCVSSYVLSWVMAKRRSEYYKNYGACPIWPYQRDNAYTENFWTYTFNLQKEAPWWDGPKRGLSQPGSFWASENETWSSGLFLGNSNSDSDKLNSLLLWNDSSL